MTDPEIKPTPKKRFVWIALAVLVVGAAAAVPYLIGWDTRPEPPPAGYNRNWTKPRLIGVPDPPPPPAQRCWVTEDCTPTRLNPKQWCHAAPFRPGEPLEMGTCERGSLHIHDGLRCDGPRNQDGLITCTPIDAGPVYPPDGGPSP